MTASIVTRLDQKNNRTPLEEVIPLVSPYVLMVDPSSACNLRCKFCPTGNTDLIRSTGRFQGFMNFPLFNKIIDEAGEFNDTIKTLRLYKEGEPLVNPHFADMISYARKSNSFQRIDTTTNGLLLNPTLNRKIIDSGIDQINISVNGLSTDRIFDLTKVRIDFSTFLENIRDLYNNRGQCEIYIKAIHEHLTKNEREQFYDIFGPYADRIFLEHLQPNWPQFTFDYIKIDYTVGHYGQQLKERKVCPYIFYMMVINADGTASLCVQDWAHKLIIGDANTSNLKDIWNGEVANSHRIAHLELRKNDNQICRVCPVLRHGALDDIDSSAGRLLLKFIKQE